MLTLNRAQVREVDHRAIADYGLSGLVLMENAGRGAADVLCGLLAKSSGQSSEPSPLVGEGRVRGENSVAIVCGKGNNGVDGFVIARHLDLRRIGVKVLLLCNPSELRGDAAANFAIIQKTGLAIEVFAGQAESEFDQARFDAVLRGANFLVDAILGTGATGEPKSPYAEAIDQMNASGIPILAVDLPSGLDCDTGAAGKHTIRAAHTCTFVAAKPGFFVSGAEQYVGQIHVCDIGAPRRLIEEIAR
ncbi:MAG TPA: NAD(P)H-hydrate epimerase [Pirellulales bacterium]|jgi:NAD(P)H-hydrate epimerase|nr:NAD(P)H-hydrate epimerase [Pirellulales bacterium]